MRVINTVTIVISNLVKVLRSLLTDLLSPMILQVSTRKTASCPLNLVASLFTSGSRVQLQGLTRTPKL